MGCISDGSSKALNAVENLMNVFEDIGDERFIDWMDWRVERSSQTCVKDGAIFSEVDMILR
jgi:hypothetical protein